MKIHRFFRISRTIFLLFLAIQMSCPSFAEDPAPIKLYITPNEQFEFAEQLFSKGEFIPATAEYRRFIWFFPDDERVVTARNRMGESYFKAGDFDRAKTVYLETISLYEKDERVTEAFFGLSRCFLMQADVKNALAALNGVMKKSDDPDIIDRAWYEMGWISLESQWQARTPSWQEAADLFNRIRPENKDAYGVDQLLVKLDDTGNISRKSPAMAGFLSILPGGGYLYCNRYRDALMAFLLNGGLILAAVSSFENDNPALGAVIGFVETGFYSGNIYGGISSAHKYNRHQTRRFIDTLRQGTAIGLSGGDGQKQLAVFFHMNF